MSIELLPEVCRRIVRQLQAKYAWRLLDEDEFTARLFARAGVEQTPEESKIRELALNLYSIALYGACVGVDDAQRKRAGEDLFHYMYAILKTKYGAEDLVIEIAQDALLRVLQQSRNCNTPGAFLHFCLQRIRHAEDAHHREEARQRRTDSWPSGNGDEQIGDYAQIPELPAPLSSEPQALLQCVEVMERLLQAFQQIYQEKRRAYRQLEVVYYTFFQGLTDSEIGERLQTSEQQVQVLRSRGLEQIRPYNEFLHLLREWVTNCKSSGIVVLYQ